MCFPCRVFHWLCIYLLNIAMWVDEGINVTILPWLRAARLIPYNPSLGNAHYTISQWTAYSAMRGSKVAKGFCWLLTKIWGLWIKKPGYSHCYDAIHTDDGSLISPSENEG